MTAPSEKSEYAPPPYVLTARQRRYLAVRRVLDGALALIALVVLALPLGLLAAAVKLSGPGEPVLFRQERLGRDETPFILYKFRSMTADGRVTGLGRFLRETSLDELPQLGQVLTGKMSLVGPRPLVPQEADIHALRRAAGVYQLRPGLTGLAQISGRDKLGPREKAAWDRRYLESVGPLADGRILLATVGKVLRREDIEKK